MLYIYIKHQVLKMKNQLLKLLKDEFPEIDFTASNKLVDEGIIDSLTITGIIAFLTTELCISIPYEEIIEDNFNSIDELAAMVERLQA